MILRSLVGGAQQTISVDGRTMSYDELLGAAAASARGLGAGQRVAVVATPTMETVVGVVGALLAGAVVVPVPADAGPAEREHILRDSGAEQIGPVDVGARAPYRPVDVDPEQPALVLYTSGTTGPPKGVLLSHRAICAGLDGLADAWAWGAADVLAHGLPLFHVHGLVLGVLGPLRFGSGLVHVGRPTPDNYAGAALRGATMWFGVPTVWSRLADRPRAASALSGARLLVSGSAPLPVPVFERIRELTGLEVAERYGMSETLITVATRADGVTAPAGSGCRSQAWTRGSAPRTAPPCRPTATRWAVSRCAAPPCSAATSTARRPPPLPGPRTAGSAPVTWP